MGRPKTPFTKCERCEKSDVDYYALGKCRKCYWLDKYHNDPEYRERRKQSNNKYNQSEKGRAKAKSNRKGFWAELTEEQKAVLRKYNTEYVRMYRARKRAEKLAS